MKQYTSRSELVIVRDGKRSKRWHWSVQRYHKKCVPGQGDRPFSDAFWVREYSSVADGHAWTLRGARTLALQKVYLPLGCIRFEAEISVQTEYEKTPTKTPALYPVLTVPDVEIEVGP